MMFCCRREDVRGQRKKERKGLRGKEGATGRRGKEGREREEIGMQNRFGVRCGHEIGPREFSSVRDRCVYSI
jgi:hypothetical protein